MKFCKIELLIKAIFIAVLGTLVINFFLKDKRSVDLQEAKELFDSEEVIFLDARASSVYKRERHIPGAINVPHDSKEKEKLMAGIPKDKKLVIYCHSSKCKQANFLDKRIRKLGYKNTLIFDGGIVKWMKAEYPLSYRH